MSVLYDEGRVVAVNKPSGVRVEDCAREHGRRLIHRIDQPTSGVVLLGDDARTVQRMQRQLREGRIARRYLAIAHGVVAAGVIESALVRDRGDGLRGSAPSDAPGSKRARTVVTPLAVAGDQGATLVESVLETGRTHQIRIHLAERGAPIVGERVYIRDYLASGRAPIAAARLMLHAWEVSFVHPTTKRLVTVTAPVPADMRDAASALDLALPRVS